LVETVEVDSSGSRQIRSKERSTALLRDRRDDIEAAVREASSILQSSANLADQDGWRVTNLEAKFALTLSAEAGVILSKVSAEACLEIRISIERPTGNTGG